MTRQSGKTHVLIKSTKKLIARHGGLKKMVVTDGSIALTTNDSDTIQILKPGDSQNLFEWSQVFMEDFK